MLFNFSMFRFFDLNIMQTKVVPLDIVAAAERLKAVVNHTPLTYNRNLSRKYSCEVYLKREDLQVVRSYKLRGAFNMMSSAAGRPGGKRSCLRKCRNHAQGFAYSCRKLGIHGVIFMPL
jgi:threonine dehydratase